MTGPRRYRHLPTEVTAMELGPTNTAALISWVASLGYEAVRVDFGGVRITTPRGPIRVDLGEWVLADHDNTVTKAGPEFDHTHERTHD